MLKKETTMVQKVSKFCERCPRRLNNTPDSPCTLGMEYAESQAEDRRKRDVDERGCLWGISSAAHNYCFWKYAETLDEPVPDEEISALLGLTKSGIDKTLSSAIEKLKKIKDTEELLELKEVILDVISRQEADNTVYMPDDFAIPIPSFSAEHQPNEELPDDLLDKIKTSRRKNKSLPTHRDGKKTDLFGLYSKKTIEAMGKK